MPVSATTANRSISVKPFLMFFMIFAFILFSACEWSGKSFTLESLEQYRCHQFIMSFPRI